MSLERYRKKRNFKKTSEPAPSMGHSNGVLHFVVQKHDASHLHYDFRLENHGVLKSWAVPKGVSIDPKTRRLAIEVEDHPFDYRNFEGTIPEGNYGAGTVMVWDEGEYYIDPNLSKEENDKEIEKALDKGQLTFYLKGKKLKGKFTIVKIHGKDNQWLLIKKDDASANKPIKHLDESVISGRTLEEIANKKSKRIVKVIPKQIIPKSKKTSSGKPDVFPHNIQPMLATLIKEPFDQKGWIFEVKWDGYRILAEKKNGKVRLYTRNNKTYDEHFPSVVDDLKKIPFDFVIDGEMVVVDDQGRSHFQLLQNYMKHQEGELLYYVFDILYLDKTDVQGLSLEQRKEILDKLIPKLNKVRISQFVPVKGKAFYKIAKENSLEGIIAKNLESSYQSGVRSKDWLKIKAILEQEAIICGFTEGQGSRKYFGALILGLYKDKQLTYVGHTGGGFNQELLKDIHKRLTSLLTPNCPFKVKPKTNAPVTWVKPQLLCEIKFQEWTHEGLMRQPIFLGMRDDKAPKEAEPEQIDPKTSKTVVSLSIPKVELTHLSKVYWPQEGYTKGDLIKYYQDVASFILPYLKDRPQSLHRQPDGIQDPGFFQKNMNIKPPAWIKTINIPSESRKENIRYLICDDKETLAYINNLGCIEINPWSSVTKKLNYPDFLVLDFDPVDLDFKKLVDVVLETRKILQHAGMEGFCKTSGSRGIHVYVPTQRKYTYDQIKDFVHLLCMVINKEMPNITSLERSPQKRKGLIYLDYLQNHYSATMAAPYSLRPKAGATISTPLQWQEVKRSLDPHDYNLKTIFSRLKKKGDLWKGVLGKGFDMKKSLDILERLFKKK